jgi:serine/threonine protein kinase
VSGEAGLPQPGDVVAGKYRVDRALGAGGMGAVYRATHTRTGQAVALKWLRPKLAAEPRAAQRLLREARASARIRHPNVVDIYGIEEQDGQAFLVFELLEGETLRELLRRRRLGTGECLSLLVPAMRGVAAAHAQGVVHRDIKPENVFLTRDPDDPQRCIPKVLDFGISKLTADSPLVEGTLTATGAMLGTPHYMSLEQLQATDVDARTDVYAFGVVLYECLTGKRPYESDNFSAIVVKIATETPADPLALRPELPPALCDVVRKAMARQRDDRYTSMHALIDALKPFVEADPPWPPEPSLVPPAQPAISESEPTRTSAGARTADAPSTATRSRWPVAALAALAATGLSGWFLLSRGPAAPPAHLESASSNATLADRAAPAPTAGSTPPASTEASGADTQAPERTGAQSTSASGWVYLGEYDGARWKTRYFDGFGNELPPVGATIRPRGRSYVRSAMPDALGDLALVRTTIGSETRVEVLELARWAGGSYVWARVRSVR